MRCVIISGGRISDYSYIKSLIHPDDMVVCADSGYDHAVKMGISPDAVVGDLDSVSRMPRDTKIVKYPPEKDYTDTETAIEWGRGAGADSFLLLAATGTRLDHTIANIFQLKGMYLRGEDGILVDEHNRIRYSASSVTLEEEPGTLVSMVPITTCRGVSNTGLGYPLDDACLPVESARGISNYVTSSPAGISVREGEYLVIVARD